MPRRTGPGRRPRATMQAVGTGLGTYLPVTIREAGIYPRPGTSQAQTRNIFSPAYGGSLSMPVTPFAGWAQPPSARQPGATFTGLTAAQMAGTPATTGTQGAAPAWATTPQPFLPWYTQPNPQAPAQAGAQPTAQPGAQPAGGGGGGGGRGQWQAPPGVNPQWYNQFRQEHGGQTPEQFYGNTGEGLPEAMADEEWGRGFAAMYGRPPTEDDWRAHWFATRGGGGGGTPTRRELRQQEAWQKERRAQRRARQRGMGEKESEQTRTGEEQRAPRAPLYVPPQITWR